MRDGYRYSREGTRRLDHSESIKLSSIPIPKPKQIKYEVTIEFLDGSFSEIPNVNIKRIEQNVLFLITDEMSIEYPLFNIREIRTYEV